MKVFYVLITLLAAAGFYHVGQVHLTHWFSMTVFVTVMAACTTGLVRWYIQERWGVVAPQQTRPRGATRI